MNGGTVGGPREPMPERMQVNLDELVEMHA